MKYSLYQVALGFKPYVLFIPKCKVNTLRSSKEIDLLWLFFKITIVLQKLDNED